MIDVIPLADSTPLIVNPRALRERWMEDGVLFIRNFMDPDLIAWTGGRYRDPLAAEGLIDLSIEAPMDRQHPEDTASLRFAGHQSLAQGRSGAETQSYSAGHLRGRVGLASHSGTPVRHADGPVAKDQDFFSGRYKTASSMKALSSRETSIESARLRPLRRGSSNVGMR